MGELEIPGASVALASMHARFLMHDVSATPDLELKQILRRPGDDRLLPVG